MILGEELELVCVASGSPAPTYTWLRDAHNFTSQTITSGPLMRIRRVKKEDEGEYTCIANNTNGQERRRVRISITGKLDDCLI